MKSVVPLKPAPLFRRFFRLASKEKTVRFRTDLIESAIAATKNPRAVWTRGFFMPEIQTGADSAAVFDADFIEKLSCRIRC